ncbi:putative GNS1 SUR4 family [Trypanosoma vivax]|nr:putative GNS1 SUR4 family [Trypanosoma vivax]
MLVTSLIGTYTATFRGTLLGEWMRNHYEIPITASLAYIALVHYVQKNVMPHRQPMNLRSANILWNLLLTVFSIMGTHYTVPRLIKIATSTSISRMESGTDGHRDAFVPVATGSFYTSTCVWDENMFFNKDVGFWVAAFALSKIPEMLDTVFLVLQKKPVIFLHWYHHLTVMLFSWHAYAYNIASGLWFAAMNYSVHSVMYFYYFACACGYRRVVRPVAPFITTLQILQMVVGTFIVCYTYTVKHVLGYKCMVGDVGLRAGLVMYVSYLLLFSQLFYRSYIDPLGKTGRSGHAKIE